MYSKYLHNTAREAERILKRSCPRIQARIAHGKAGAYLAERASILETEVNDSRRILAATLAPNRGEGFSSAQAWVLGRVGLGPGNDDELRESSESQELDGIAVGGSQVGGGVGSHGRSHEATVREEVSHRQGKAAYRALQEACAISPRYNGVR